MQNIISVANLRKSFAKADVLKDVSFSLDEGEVLSIIGPSGSGKSTLLRCVTQLEEISSGRIDICGINLVRTESGRVVYAPKKTLQKIALNVGLVFQNFNLFPHFSVLRNITEAQELVLKTDKKDAQKTAQALLEKMGLADKANAYPCELSGGQQQRVSIARALALRPKALFFDEPTSALDPELTQEILRVIKSLAAEKMTMVVVTHAMSFAREISDKVIFLDAGQVVEQGKSPDIFDNPCEERTKAFLSKLNG